MPDTPSDQSRNSGGSPSTGGIAFPAGQAAAVPRSLALQLVILVASVVIVAVGGVSFLAAYRVEDAIFAREALRFESENDRLASELVSSVARIREDVLGVLHVGSAQQILRELHDNNRSAPNAASWTTTDAQTATSSRAALAALFSADLRARPSHLQFRLIALDDGGRELVRVDRSGPGGAIRVVPDEALQAKGDRDYVRQAANLPPGEVYVSPIELNRERGQIETPFVPVVRAATPVYTDTGEVTGVLVLNADMRPALASIVPSFEGGQIFLLADTGDYLVHPDPSRTFESAFGRGGGWRSDFGAAAAVIDDDTSVPLEHVHEGTRYVLAGATVQIADGPRVLLVQAVPKAQIVAPARRALRITTMGGLVAVLLASALSWRVARSLTRPITSMTTAVSGFTGTEEVEVPVSARGEIGVLARAFQAMARDIVERRAREGRYVAVVESTDDAILSTDRTGTIVTWNPASQRLFGYSPEEAMGQKVEMLIPVPRREEFSATLARVLEGGEIARYESTLCHRNGRLIPVAVTDSPVRAPSGEVIGVSKIVRNLTARKEAEEQFRLAVEASASGLVLVDAEGKILMVNAQIERIFDYPRSDLIGQTLEILLPKDARERHRGYRTEYTRKPEARPMGADRELYGRRRDGSEFPLEIGLSPLSNSSGTRVIATVVDISARRHAAERLRSYATRLERSNADLENFAYVTSHDLKAPLRGIASVATWLAEDLQDVINEDQRENLALMLERTDRLNNLIDGILTYSRVGRPEIGLEPIDTATIVDDVIDAIAPPEGISIRIDGSLPAVRFDETQLRQVFQNLIDNAIKHMGKPTGEVVVSSERGTDRWDFEIRDTGVGIPERHFERIFQLFHTLRPKDEVQATGLGLAIVKRIVENRGGTVSVRSTVGDGTTFRFSIPDAVHENPDRNHEGPAQI